MVAKAASDLGDGDGDGDLDEEAGEVIQSATDSVPNVVSCLPGFEGPLPFYLETGYEEVDEAKDAHSFYYFVKSERKPQEDPLMVWLTGGPGCSALSALLFEIGPLKIDIPGYTEGLPNLLYNPYTWTKVCNIIFLDSPIGTGFSYSGRNYEAGDTKSAHDVYAFMRKWFMSHQEFLSNPLYIGGDSYSGIIVPLVAQTIANGNQAGLEVFFNLKGYLVGNPVTDAQFDSGAFVPYAHQMGLLSDELYKLAERSCGGEYASPWNVKCADSLQLINEEKDGDSTRIPSLHFIAKKRVTVQPSSRNFLTNFYFEEKIATTETMKVSCLQCLDGVNYVHILEPLCFYVSPKPLKVVTDRRQALRELVEELFLSQNNLPLECRSSGYLLSYSWANNDTVREALHIRKGTRENWKRCNDDIPYTHDLPSVVKFHQNLTNSGYRALVYSGDHDMFVPHIGTQAWIRSLNSSIVDDWRPWSVNGQVAGFTRTYSNNLTFATVKGGGHTAPEYNPKECLAMLRRWMSEAPL